MIKLFLFFFFFFQAEDGIRDRNVTGVQTCALPILFRQIVASICERHVVPFALRLRNGLCRSGNAGSSRRGRQDRRSEERRVGKSVDIGGRRITKKKKKKSGQQTDCMSRLYEKYTMI